MTLERAVYREEDDQCAKLVDKLKIGIYPLVQDAGSSFLSVCLAKHSLERGFTAPAVVEFGGGEIYDALGMDKRFTGRSFMSYQKCLQENRSVKGIANIDGQINWYLKMPGEGREPAGLFDCMRLVSSARGDIIFYDFSGVEKMDIEEQVKLLAEMDRTAVVIDPLPSRLIGGYGRLCMLRNSGISAVYAVNKDNKGVNRRELLDYLRIKKPAWIPYISPEHIYNAEYTCRIPYEVPILKKQLKDPISLLLDRILSADSPC